MMDLDHIIPAGFRMITQKGWGAFHIYGLAQETHVDFYTLAHLIPDKKAFIKLSYVWLESLPLVFLDEGSLHDRLFDGIMCRFEALTPYKQAIIAILENQTISYLSAEMGFCWVSYVYHFFQKCLNGGSSLEKALATAAYLRAFPVWLSDGSDQNATMACVDQTLRTLLSYGVIDKKERPLHA